MVLCGGFIPHRTRTQGNTAVSSINLSPAITFSCGIGLACLSVVLRYASYGNRAAACLKVLCREPRAWHVGSSERVIAPRCLGQ